MRVEAQVRAALGLPGIRSFLDAVDRVANSNTFFLAAGSHLRELTPEGIFRYLESPAFRAAMFECDAERGWFNLHDPADPPGDITSPRDFYAPRPGKLLRATGPAELTVAPMSPKQVRSKLLWLLTDVPSPYGGRLSEKDARPLVEGFLTDLQRAGTLTAAQCKPDFLSSTGYWTADEDFEPEGLAYFDGGEADFALFCRAGGEGYLLLTNGSP